VTTSAAGALDGVRVLDLTRALAGPYCTLMLGDHGADVIKVEMPGTGDETREWAPPSIKGISAYYLSINRNKRSVTLDLKNADGKRVLERLIERSDVVVENFSPGTLARLGFPDDRVRAINRRAILCHISGFGQDGPGRAWPAYDLIVQGMGGIMSLTGEPGGEPVMVGVPQADMVAGMFAAFAIVAALHARARIGEGQVIDAARKGAYRTPPSPFPGALPATPPQPAWLSGKEAESIRNTEPSVADTKVAQTRMVSRMWRCCG